MAVCLSVLDSIDEDSAKKWQMEICTPNSSNVKVNMLLQCISHDLLSEVLFRKKPEQEFSALCSLKFVTDSFCSAVVHRRILI